MNRFLIVPGALLAGIIQTITGFGASIVLMLFLPLCIDLLQATAVSCAISAFLGMSLAIRFRRQAHYRKLLLPCVLYLSASTGNIALAPGLNLDLLVVCFGAFLVILSGYFLLFKQCLTLRPSTCSAIVCSLFSGVTSGLFGIGGPLMALYYLSCSDNKETYISTDMPTGGTDWSLHDYNGNLILDGHGGAPSREEDQQSGEMYILNYDSEEEDYVYYDQSGKEVLRWPEEIDDQRVLCTPFFSSDRLLWTFSSNENWETHAFITDLSGNEIVSSNRYYAIEYAVFEKTIFCVGGYHENGAEKKELFDLDGNILVSDIDEIVAFDGNRAVIEKDSALGLIDMHGNWLYQETQ